MNRARVATLLHELVDAVFDDVAEEHPPRDPQPPKSQPKITDIDRMKARKQLRKLGTPLR